MHFSELMSNAASNGDFCLLHALKWHFKALQGCFQTPDSPRKSGTRHSYLFRVTISFTSL